MSDAEFLKVTSTKDEPDVSLEDLDDLLAQLTTEELDELNGDFDPDNSFLPPSDRMKSQTDKVPTGPYSRKQLLSFLEKKAKEEKDWENIQQYVKKAVSDTPSSTDHPWKAKVIPKTEEEQAIETEWDDILTQASEEELVDLAAVLGFHGMLNQTQYYASENNESIEGGGFTGIAKSEPLKVMKFEPGNTTDVEASLKQISDNDAKLKHLNLNNIKNISHERLEAICDGLKSNTNLEILEMASVAMTDRTAKILAAALQENKTLKTLNIESNFVSGERIVDILKAINTNQALVELRVANQKPEALGNKVETQITKLVFDNHTLIRFGIALEFPDARVRVTEKIQENNDQFRKKRMGDKGGQSTNVKLTV